MCLCIQHISDLPDFPLLIDHASLLVFQAVGGFQVLKFDHPARQGRKGGGSEDSYVYIDMSYVFGAQNLISISGFFF